MVFTHWSFIGLLGYNPLSKTQWKTGFFLILKTQQKLVHWVFLPIPVPVIILFEGFIVGSVWIYAGLCLADLLGITLGMKWDTYDSFFTLVFCGCVIASALHEALVVALYYLGTRWVSITNVWRKISYR